MRQVGPVAIDGRRPQEHAPLAVARLEQRRRAVGEAAGAPGAAPPPSGGTARSGRSAPPRAPRRRAVSPSGARSGWLRSMRPRRCAVAVPPALPLAVVAIGGGGADGAQRLQRLRQEIAERVVVGVGIDVVAERDEEAAAVAHVVLERGAVGRLDVAQKDDVEVGQAAVAQLVGRDGGDVELRVVAIAGAQRGLEVEDLVVAARGARIAVDDEHAQIAAHLDAGEAAIVGRQRDRRRARRSISCTPISLSFVDCGKTWKKRFAARPCAGTSTSPLVTGLPSTRSVTGSSLSGVGAEVGDLDRDAHAARPEMRGRLGRERRRWRGWRPACRRRDRSAPARDRGRPPTAARRRSRAPPDPTISRRGDRGARRLPGSAPRA